MTERWYKNITSNKNLGPNFPKFWNRQNNVRNISYILNFDFLSFSFYSFPTGNVWRPHLQLLFQMLQSTSLCWPRDFHAHSMHCSRNNESHRTAANIIRHKFLPHNCASNLKRRAKSSYYSPNISSLFYKENNVKWRSEQRKKSKVLGETQLNISQFKSLKNP